MTSAIETLESEHQNIRRLLNAMEHQVQILADARDPDYDLLLGIADYFCDVPDRCHHRKEDAVLARLRLRHRDEAASVGDLAREHRDAAARARRFRENLAALFRDAILPRNTIVSAARSFMDAERRHMRMEEARFFPVAAHMLTPLDWPFVESELGQERDPLFGEGAGSALRDRLLAWESAQVA